MVLTGSWATSPRLLISSSSCREDDNQIRIRAAENVNQITANVKDDAIGYAFRSLETHINSAPADGKVALFRKRRQGFGDESVKAIAGQMAGKKESITALTTGFQRSTESRQQDSPRSRSLEAGAKGRTTGAELTAGRLTLRAWMKHCRK